MQLSGNLQVQHLHVLRSGSTSDNFDQLARNHGLTGAVEQNLEPGDHVAGVLGGVLNITVSQLPSISPIQSDRSTYVHGISPRRLLASMALSKSPEEGVGESIFAQVTEHLVVNFESSVVGYISQ